MLGAKLKRMSRQSHSALAVQEQDERNVRTGAPKGVEEGMELNQGDFFSFNCGGKYL